MKKQKQTKQYVDQNPIEAFKDLGSSVAKSFTEDLGKEVVSDLWAQLLGGKEESKKAKSGDLKPGEELNLKEDKKPQHAEPGINYAREIIYAEKNEAVLEKQEIRVQIQQIQIELKQIVKSSKELQVEFKDVAVENMPENVGKLHLNFFEWVLSQLRRARMRIEDSAQWKTALSSKKGQRQYWTLFKKHGTSFGLSGERVVATQVG